MSNTSRNASLWASTVLISVGLTSATAAAQNSYVSDTDKLLTIHKISVLPATDNVGGLYSRYVENKIGDLLKAQHRFDLAQMKDADPTKTLDDYESDPTTVKKLGQSNNVQALVGAHVSKGPNGVEITEDLFLTGDGDLLIQETQTTAGRFDVNDVEQKTTELFNDMVKKIPYGGLVLSRQGNRVTMDIGTKDGVHDGQIVSIEQVITLKRHPKFHFMLASEKEILGRVKIVKADETLSFGTVLSEKEAGLVSTDSKITGLDYVNYADAGADAGLEPAAAAPGADTQAVSFGKNPKEWAPPKHPSLGKVGFALGLGSVADTMNVNQSNLASSAGIYPQLDVSGEIWLTTNWYVAADLSQGVLSISNPGGGSIGANNAHYDFHGGYKFLLQDDFFGPKIDLHLGLNKYSFSVENSTPLTSITYNGLYIGLGGSAPVTVDRTWYVDAFLDEFVLPSASETPGTSGSDSNSSVTKFGIGGSHKLSPQFWLKADLDFEVYSTNYSDTGNSSRQQLFTLLSGIEYMF